MSDTQDRGTFRGGLRITVDADYGEGSNYRHVLERDSAFLSIYEWMDMLRNITVSMGYTDEQWKKGVVDMAGQYQEEVKPTPKINPLKPMTKGPFKITNSYDPYKNTAYLEENDC